MKNYISLLSFILLITNNLFSQPLCVIDSSFAINGKIVSDSATIGVDAKYFSNGKFVVACNSFLGGNDFSYLKKFHNNGFIDINFGINGKLDVLGNNVSTKISCIKILNDITYVAGHTNTGSSNFPFVAAFDSLGNNINSFGNNGVFTYPLYLTCADITIDNTGNIYLVGNCFIQGLFNQYVMKINNSGIIDNSFANNGIYTLPSTIPNQYYVFENILIDNANNIVLCGRVDNQAVSDNLVLVVRLNPNGQMDNSFGTNGMSKYSYQNSFSFNPKKIIQESNNNYIIAGDVFSTNQDYFILKIDNSGTINNSFSNNGWAIYDVNNINTVDALNDIELLSDGRILMCGESFDHQTYIGHFNLFCILPNGNRDLNFYNNGIYPTNFNPFSNSMASIIEIESNGKVLLVGLARRCTPANGCGPQHLAMSKYLNIFSLTGINENPKNEAIVLYPNPATNNITISNSSKFNSITITDISGRIVKKIITDNTTNYTLNIEELSKGMYILNIADSNRKIAVKKFSKL